MENTKTTLAKIEHVPPTLRDIVQERMRTAIIEGHFAPGERLVERPIGEQLGVSRTVVRETIRYLEAEGLVEIIPNRGPIVARLDWDQAQQIYDIRRHLEGAAASACAVRFEPTFPDHLRTTLHALRGSLTAQNMPAVFQATTEFYQLIFEQAGHAVAWEIVHRLNGRISRLRALTLSTQDRKTPGIVHLSNIRDAILKKDPDAARQAVQAHLDDASDIARHFLQEENQSKIEGP